MEKLVGRSELARILGLSESMTARLSKAGKIKPVTFIGKRQGYRVEDALALRAERDASAKRRVSFA
jgi:predicted site-specific integrase-resolvase